MVTSVPGDGERDFDLNELFGHEEGTERAAAEAGR
jgi:hypothetical protein